MKIERLRSLRFRLRPRFSLAGLLVIMTLTCVLCAIVADEVLRAERQRAAVQKVKSLGGEVLLKYDRDARWSSVSGWLQSLVNERYFSRAIAVRLDTGPARRKEDFSFLGDLPMLESLRLDGKAVDDEALSHLAQLEYLHSLNVNDSSITFAGLKHIEGLQKLDNLSLRSAAIDDEALDFLEHLPNVAQLDLYNTDVSDQGLKLLARCPKLESVDLGGRPITDSGLAALAASKSLRQLILRGSRVTERGIIELQNAAPSIAVCDDRGAFTRPSKVELRQSSALNWGGSFTTDASLVQLAECRQLEHLSLENTRISDAGMASIAEKKDLTILRLRGALVTDDGLLHLGGLINLTELSLGGATISDKGLKSLASLVKLKRLDVDRSPATGEFLADLNAPDLEYLSIDACPIEAAHLRHLSRFPKLRQLYVHCSSIDDEAIEALGALPQLRGLMLRGKPLSREQRLRLSQLLPKCFIDTPGAAPIYGSR